MSSNSSQELSEAKSSTLSKWENGLGVGWFLNCLRESLWRAVTKVKECSVGDRCGFENFGMVGLNGVGEIASVQGEGPVEWKSKGNEIVLKLVF